MNLEPILKFKMTDMEAKAYKLALLWTVISQREFPNYKHTKLGNKDPRKSSLFRYCYKLATETNGIIEDKDYKLYITAQLQVFKGLSNNILIEPSILVGDKAWKRWKYWRYQHNLSKNANKTDNETVTYNKSLIINELNKTKSFFLQKLGKHPSTEDIFRLIKEKILNLWLSVEKISPYYILLSPLIKNVIREDYHLVSNIDFSLYKKSITPDIEKYFAENFAYEFNRCLKPL